MIDFAINCCGRNTKRHADFRGDGQFASARMFDACVTTPDRSNAFLERHKVLGIASMNDRLAEPGISNYTEALPSLPAHALEHGAICFPCAYGNQSRILSLPIFPEMTAAQEQALGAGVREFAA